MEILLSDGFNNKIIRMKMGKSMRSKKIPYDWFENTSWMRIKWSFDVGCIVDKN